MINVIKIHILFVIIFIFSSCGFKPIYKLSENNLDTATYSIKFKTDPGYVIKNKILEIYNFSSSESLYTINLNTNKISTPLIINTNGTISKFRIEVTIDFDVNTNDSGNKIYSDVARGFSEYIVQTSEISTDEKRKQAIEIATNEAVQMMSIKIQSNILQSQ